ncbi:NADH:ubiquinone reductase (Na(+)-transporting) subunit C [Elusimicrobiota bacterium]
MEKNKNAYALVFVAVVCVVCSLFVSSAAILLKSKQDQNFKADIKKNILISLDLIERGQKVSLNDIDALYGSKIREIKVKGLSRERLPVYVSMAGDKPAGYAIPIEGKGLWSTIYGYLAIEPDGNTVKGVTFYKHGETPGLGGEIESAWFQDNFKGKKLFDKSGVGVYIAVAKGKVIESDPLMDHRVDGISGATLTCRGVSNMFFVAMMQYDEYFRKISGVKKKG